MLQNASFLATVAVHTAENGPSKVRQGDEQRSGQHRWYTTPVGLGEFTCCSLNHRLPNGTELPCDLVSVGAVLEKMFDLKKAHLLKTGQLEEWRFLMSRRSSIFAGLKAFDDDNNVVDHKYAKVGPA